MAADEALKLMQERIDQLYAQVDALQAENAALREIAQEVANAQHAGGNSTVAYISDLLPAKARTLLGKE